MVAGAKKANKGTIHGIDMDEYLQLRTNEEVLVAVGFAAEAQYRSIAKLLELVGEPSTCPIMVIAIVLDREYREEVVGKWSVTRANNDEGTEPIEVAPTIGIKARIRRAHVIFKDPVDKPHPTGDI